jgi:hypothetical protein
MYFMLGITLTKSLHFLAPAGNFINVQNVVWNESLAYRGTYRNVARTVCFHWYDKCMLHSHEKWDGNED